MAPLRRAAAAGSLAVGDYQKILFFSARAGNGSFLLAKICKVYYTLEGWYETADCTGEKFNFSTPINANKILYAKWTAKQVPYTIRHRDKDTNEPVAPDTTGTGAYG